jgi:hypothetical protein
LQEYLAGSSYETASFGETTSADDLMVKTGETTSSGALEIFRQSDLSRNYDEAKQAAKDVDDYEQKIVEKYNQKDLYRSKGLSYSKISFNDLTLQENLNYVKFNLKDTHDAFRIFDETKE